MTNWKMKPAQIRASLQVLECHVQENLRKLDKARYIRNTYDRAKDTRPISHPDFVQAKRRVTVNGTGKITLAPIPASRSID